MVQAVLDRALKYLSANVSNREHVIQEVHDPLQAYYTFARQRFVDYTCHQAAGRFIFLGSDTPLTVFTPAFVAKMSQEKVQSIAEEDRQAKRKRENLAKEVDDLERGERSWDESGWVDGRGDDSMMTQALEVWAER